MRAPLKTLGDLWKFRVRMALARSVRPVGPLATPDELDRLVALQTAYWKGHPPLAGAAAQQALSDLNDRTISAFVFSVRGRRIRMWNKRPADTAAHREQQRSFLKRALLYQAFLAKTLAGSGLDGAFDIALDVNDMAADSAELPIFAFQKERGAHNLLMPDVDFFHSRWYRGERDPLTYEQKTNSACFVGSSTGGWLSAEDVRRQATPRLRAAAHFHGNPRVLFRIANAVQCRSDEARAALMSQPYFAAQLSWPDQLRHRFLISMDGNGAACSRLVKGLLSNGVVIKYDSPHELYYFAALEPGTDYLPATRDEDVERMLDAEAAHPGTFKHVADAGQRFARRYLTIRSVMDYTARLLRAYAALPRATSTP
jgi:hypothetical protein